MTEQTTLRTEVKKPAPAVTSSDADKDIMRKVRLICGRGNNAEIKQRSQQSTSHKYAKQTVESCHLDHNY